MQHRWERPGDIVIPDTLRRRGHEHWPERRDIGQDQPLQTKPARGRVRRAIAAAMSVLWAHALEGFASCAVGLYPELFYPPDGPAERRGSGENGWPNKLIDKRRY